MRTREVMVIGAVAAVVGFVGISWVVGWWPSIAGVWMNGYHYNRRCMCDSSNFSLLELGEIVW